MRSDMDHTVLPANYTMPASTPQPQSITALWLVLIYRPTEGRRLSRPGWLVTYRNKVPPPGVEPGHVTHPSTNRARRRVTSLIRPTTLPLRHAATHEVVIHIPVRLVERIIFNKREWQNVHMLVCSGEISHTRIRSGILLAWCSSSFSCLSSVICYYFT